MKTKKIFTLAFFILCFFSCAEERSDHVFSEQKMIGILVDYSVATEIVAMSYLPKDSSSMYMQQIYKPKVLLKHGVSSADFDSSYSYYIKKPKVFSALQAAVADSLKLMHLRGDLDF